MTLLALRTKGALNSLARRPLRYLFAAAILALVYWGVFVVTRRSVAFGCGGPRFAPPSSPPDDAPPPDSEGLDDEPLDNVVLDNELHMV